ncbi:MAG: bifunctional DNA-formamidopyrimidine glycosylase/DNA-(apurinic or apyrimidinic site) lyase [Mariprofundaceae bacterium]
MPELPEVETVRRGLAPVVEGGRIEQARFHRPGLRHPFPAGANLEGRRVEHLRRRAKYLLFILDDAHALVWHLGMSGRFHLLARGDARLGHEHAALDFADGPSLRYVDPRRFGFAARLSVAEMTRHPWFAQLGPEPLSDAFDGAHLAAAFRGRRAPVKALLMDARIVVGVGNIYASEALHRAGIHPARAGGRIARARLDRLAGAVKAVLAEAIEAGGSTLRDFARVDGRPGYFAHAFAVYGRAGEVCRRCGGRIRRIVQAGRASFYCPGCQR